MDPVEKKQKPIGAVRVAKYYPGKPEPRTEGYRNVLIHTTAAGSVGGPLSPYVLRNEQGQLLENVWQFSKLYAKVAAQKTRLSSRHPQSRVIWEHPGEVHVSGNREAVAGAADPTHAYANRFAVGGEPTPAYWAWRAKGMANAYAVRYPNGFNGRKECICSLWQGERLGYIEARKQIYCGEYARLAPPTPAFKALQALLAQGVNLQLVEVDGPDPSLNYPPYDQISAANPGLLITEETIRLLINDERNPFGHGFVIAALLLGGEAWMR